MKLLTAEQILSYISEEETQYRATLKSLKEQGKTYRCRDVTRTVACINILCHLRDAIKLPEKNARLTEAMGKLGELLKS